MENAFTEQHRQFQTHMHPPFSPTLLPMIQVTSSLLQLMNNDDDDDYDDDDDDNNKGSMGMGEVVPL